MGADGRKLLEIAREARENAYAPYSGFKVGAAVEADDGRVFTGVNVENASYGLTICAERSAIARAVAEGARKIRAVAIAGPDDDMPCAPCGACRQVLFEFGPEMEIVLASGDSGEPRRSPLADLLPMAFGPATLSEADRPS